jgi:hypothetical protein
MDKLVGLELQGEIRLQTHWETQISSKMKQFCVHNCFYIKLSKIHTKHTCIYIRQKQKWSTMKKVIKLKLLYFDIILYSLIVFEKHTHIHTRTSNIFHFYHNEKYQS